MRSVKMFGKSVPLLAIVMISVLSIGAFAAVITYYGTLQSTAQVSQAVFLNGELYTVIQTETVTATQGGTAFGADHELKNLANRWIVVELDLTLDALADDDMTAYLEYKLAPTITGLPGDEDDIHFFFSDPTTWGSFSDVSFDFHISGASGRTPHVNLWLRDPASDDVLQLTTWNGGDPDALVSISGDTAKYDKADFVHTHGVPITSAHDSWNVREVRIQSGNPSDDPSASGDLQVAYVSDIRVNNAVLTKIELPMTDYPNQPGRRVHFRIAYEFDAGIIPYDYTTTVGVVPIGTIGISGVTIDGVVYP